MPEHECNSFSLLRFPRGEGAKRKMNNELFINLCICNSNKNYFLRYFFHSFTWKQLPRKTCFMCRVLAGWIHSSWFCSRKKFSVKIYLLVVFTKSCLRKYPRSIKTDLTNHGLARLVLNKQMFVSVRIQPYFLASRRLLLQRGRGVIYFKQNKMDDCMWS